MNRRNLTLLTTALIVCVAALSSNALAGSIKIPVWGSDTSTITDPGVQWVDSDGITHYRGLVMMGIIEGQDDDGTPILGESVSVVNMNVDMATGDGDFICRTRIETAYGDLNGAWEGKLQATLTGFVYDGTYNLPHGYGDFEGWHDRGIWTGVMGSGFITWEGVFHIPGGHKAAAIESTTLSAVKDLYR